jgi:tripeptide aminopeptidase
MLLERFLNYVKIDTQSDEDSQTTPSTAKQLDLAKLLVKELLEMGIKDARMDDNGYVYGTLVGNVAGPSIGLIAHMDTAPDYSGKGVKPRIIENYDGSDITLNDKDVMRVIDFPNLLENVGHTIITTDGTTLLGADNKAGIAIIMETIKELSNLPHTTVKIAFTPDEEIGRGADKFDVEGFGADFAFTIDGGPQGELNYENFNASSMSVKFNGINIHPGSAKNKMKNATHFAMEFHSMLPIEMDPAFTEGYEGFYHLTNFEGNVESAILHYIIRDHDIDKFNTKKALAQKAVEYLNNKYSEKTVEIQIKDSYFNMKEKFTEESMHIIENAIKAMESCNVKPLVHPIRGGTDGSRLSYMGLLCPNLFTGGDNFHGRYEYVSLDSMKKSVEVIKEIVNLYSKK